MQEVTRVTLQYKYNLNYQRCSYIFLEFVLKDHSAWCRKDSMFLQFRAVRFIVTGFALLGGTFEIRHNKFQMIDSLG